MVVRMRANKSHTANRRSHHALFGPRLTVDKESGVTHLRHRVSLETGKYRGKQILDVHTKLDKKTKKGKSVEKAQ